LHTVLVALLHFEMWQTREKSFAFNFYFLGSLFLHCAEGKIFWKSNNSFNGGHVTISNFGPNLVKIDNKRDVFMHSYT